MKVQKYIHSQVKLKIALNNTKNKIHIFKYKIEYKKIRHRRFNVSSYLELARNVETNDISKNKGDYFYILKYLRFCPLKMLNYYKKI